MNPDRNNKNIQQGYRNGIWYRKICHAHDKKWKRQITDGIEMPNQENIRTFGEKETNKYPGIWEANTIKQTGEKKEKSTKEE